MNRACILMASLWVLLSAPASLAEPARKLSGQVNLNTATVAQLDLLPGVGPAVAKRIVAYRSKQPFKRPQELVRVRGLGRKRFQKLARFLTVTGPTTLARGPSAPVGDALLTQAAWTQGRAEPAAR